MGNNFTDLEYIDFLDLYESQNYPWMIKGKRVFESYLKGVGIDISELQKEIVKIEIAIYYFKKCIRNGKMRGVKEITEESFLEIAKQRMKNIL